MRRWALPPAVGRFPGEPRWLGGHAGISLPRLRFQIPCRQAHPLRGKQLSGVPCWLGEYAEVFLPSHHLRWGGSLASPARWEGMRKFHSLVKPFQFRAASHTETILYSLFTILFFRPKPGEGEKQRHTHLIFRGRQRTAPPQGRFYRICTRFAGIQSLGFLSLIHSELFLIQTERFTVPPLTSGPL